ncbi:MAG: DNA mismatch repair endonuclease MutL [Acidobacteria bacterium]|nr:DNA mismatch repair endonuclease MutL [Acidobacteriota bacterium]
MRVKVLPDHVINRIAAGEVVERPASVVKELVENALDAGATRVEVELSVGGRSLIRVADDGCGMAHDDALLALERHATSKLDSADDLERITTLGFRGEALPSIAAVSRFRLSSCADPADGGVEITVEGGSILGVEGRARGRGTTVEVRDLFFNTPARRKFLHAPETELRHSQDAVVAMALARPEITFILSHGGRILIEAPPATSLDQRLRDLFRRRGLDTVHRFEAEGGGMRAWGLLAPTKGSGRPQLTLLVNGRWVRDRLLVGAVNRVLRAAGSGFGGSRVVLLLTAPPDSVDVNVHPAKTEVRFARSGAVFSLVERALRGVITTGQGQVEVHHFDSLGSSPMPTLQAAEPQATTWSAHTAQTPGPSLFPHPVYQPDEGGDSATMEPRLGQPAAGHASGAKAAAADTPFGRLIGQYRRSFILLEDQHGLVIVDQHVAHERVLYDKILRQLDGEQAPSQRLLTPLLLEVDEALATALPRLGEVLGRVGLEADVFGPETIRVSALPPDLDAMGAKQLIEEILDRATELDGVPDRVTEIFREELAASLSCRGAIKVNHGLNEIEQRALLDDLAHTDNPYRCPHGRPIILRLSQEEMERRLGRR